MVFPKSKLTTTRKGQFKLGEKTKNPSGRPPVSKEIKELFRKGTPEVIARLLKMIKDEKVDARVRLSAMREWFDRDLGKLAPTLSLPVPIGLDSASGGDATVIILPANGYEVEALEAGEIPKLEGEEEYEDSIDLGAGEFSRKE